MVAPTGACAVFDIVFVGTDVLGGPYARRNVTIGSLREGAPARAGGGARETKGAALVFKKQ